MRILIATENSSEVYDMYVTQQHLEMAQSELEKLLSANSFQQVTKQIVLLSAYLPEFPDAQKCEANEVHGCETQTWLMKNAKGEYAGFSASKIMRGLLFLLMASTVSSGDSSCDSSCDFSCNLGRELVSFDKELSASKQEAFRRLQAVIC